MCRNPYAEDRDINERDDPRCGPFDPHHGLACLRDNGDSVDNNLHEQLNLKDVEDQKGKKHWHRRRQDAVQE